MSGEHHHGSTGSWELSIPRGVSLYVGALLGPGLLLLPGIADQLAGPASIAAWAALLGLSGLFAVVFTALGIRLPGGGGVIAYAAAGLGVRAGRVVGWCFVTAVTLGAPVVCVIGAGYITSLTGGGRSSTAAVAALLLGVDVALTLGGARIGSTVQMAMVGLLLVVITVAVAGSLPSARATNWTPFAPHGWGSVGSAVSVLMLSFIGWEALAPLTRRLANPRKSLPRITAWAYAITALIYLALAAAVIAVLGPRGDTSAPIAGLMRVALGSAGPSIVAGAAALLTLATVNAYLTGAAALAAHLRSQAQTDVQDERADTSSDPAIATTQDPATRPGRFFAYVAAAGFAELIAESVGLLDPARMVTLPTSLFLMVYIGSTASAARLLSGWLRLAAILASIASAVILCFCGLLALFALCVAAIAFATAGRGRRAVKPPSPRRPWSDQPVEAA
jgi:amino acid efflux transporter